MIQATKLFIGQMDPKQIDELREIITINAILGLDEKIITFHSNPLVAIQYAKTTPKPVFMMGHYWCDLLKDIHHKEGNIVAGLIKSANTHAIVYQYSHHEEHFPQYDGFIKKSALGGGINPVSFIEFLKTISFTKS